MSEPAGHWLLGHIPAIRRDPLGLLDACAGAVAKLRLGTTAWLLLEPPDVAHVLQSEGYSKGRAFRFGRRLYGNSLLVSEGAEHQRQVRQIGGLFFRHAARSFLEPTPAIAERFAARFQPGQRINLFSAMLDLTLAISSQAIFGQDYLPGWLGGDGNAESILRAFDTAMEHVARQNFSLLPLPDWVPTPANRRYHQAIALLEDAVERSMRRRQKGETSGGFLDVLLPISPDQVRDQALVLLLGGYESTATALCWTLLLLDAHDAVRCRMLEEIQTVLGERLPVAMDARRLTWTGQVFSEALRLYPPPWLIPRTAMRADRLPSGVDLPAGALVFLSPYRTQRDARFFPEPLRFDPARFATGQRTWPDGAYFPFGDGPRRCLGESVSRAQVALILAVLCRRWRFRLEAEELPRPQPLLTLRPPDPLWVRVESVSTL